MACGAAGLELQIGGDDVQIDTATEIILAAGAIGSPQMLQLSGIGAGALLKEHGIDVVHELRASARTYRITCKSGPPIRCTASRPLTNAPTAF